MCNYAGMCKGIYSYNLVYNFLIQLLLLQSSVSVVHFSNAFWHGNEAFLKGDSSPCNLSFAIQLIWGCENMFSFVSLSKLKLFIRVALVSFVQYSCRIRVVGVVPMLHSCRSCFTRVALVSFVSLLSHSCRSSLALVL